MKLRARLDSSTARPVPAQRRDRTGPIAMPHRQAMANRFGMKAAHIPVVAGPDIAQVLARRGAEAAAMNGVIYLPHAAVAPDILAHEIVHALQQPTPAPVGEGVDFARQLNAAPAVAAQALVENEARILSAPVAGAAGEVRQSLPSCVVALRRVGEGNAVMANTPPRADPVPETATAPHGETAALDGEMATENALPLVAEVPNQPTFALPEMPETALDPAQSARRAAEAEAEAAEAALQSAESQGAAMDSYAAMAPSVKAANQAALGQSLSDGAAREQAAVEAATPTVSAALSGDAAALPTPPPIVTPTAAPMGERAPDAAPDIIVPDGPVQPMLLVDPLYERTVANRFASGANPDTIAGGLNEVSTRNPGVATAVTDRADVPLEGASDPANMDRDAQARAAETATAQTAAADAVVAGPGPEVIQPHAVAQEGAPLESIAREGPPAMPVADGAATFGQLALPEEVVAGFDTQADATMAASAQATRDQMRAEEDRRDTEQQATLSSAETQRADAEAQADTDQRTAIVEQRTHIQDERQSAVDRQQAEVAAVNREADSHRATNRAEATAEIDSSRADIDQTYNQAEHDSTAEVAAGERRAEQERADAERESANQSWWDRATDFIADAFNALANAINAVFTAVRSAVSAIIDVARRAVTALIALAARALQAIVAAFGAMLRALVAHLLADLFPEIAAALTRFINAAVAFANRAIDAVANRLIAAVNALATWVNSAINALLDVFQSAINGILALAQAVLTGDWDAVLTMVLEAVLRLLGIDPAAFYTMIGQARDAIDIIVNDPMHFVGNLIEAFVGGIELFSGNFLDHLRRGLIGWLTGALGDITLPERWDIWGVLDLGRQILGLTWDFLRERAARVIGRENVERLEMAFDWVSTLVTEGWGAVWDRIQGELDSLKDSVLESIKTMLLERVVMASITWLAGLFNPVGAIVKLVMTIWNLYQFVTNQMQRLFGIAQAVFAMLSNIAHDVLDPAKQRVEEVLGNLVPVVIDLLMSLLGVSGVAARVQNIIGSIRESIANAADRLIQRVIGALFGRGRGGAAAGGAAGAAGTAAAAAGPEIGHDVRIDVAEGTDHTLSVEQSGAGGATVMLRTEPLPLSTWLDRLGTQAAAMPDGAEKTDTLAKITGARTLLSQIDPLADQVAAALHTPAPHAATGRPAGGTTAAATAPALPPAAATAEGQVDTKQDELRPLLVAIFNALGGGANAYQATWELHVATAHPEARLILQREFAAHAAAWSALPNWEAVVGALKSVAGLMTEPLDNARNFGRMMVSAIEAMVPAEGATGDLLTTKKDSVLRRIRAGIRDNGAGYGPIKDHLHAMILSQSVSLNSGIVDAAIAQAIGQMNGDVDPVLANAVTASNIIDFLIAIASGQTVNGVNEAYLDAKWVNTADRDYIKNCFRQADPGMHEWIPTNYIPRVIDRAMVAQRQGEEAAEAAAIWIRLHHVWRSPTRYIIYRPQGGTLRRFRTNMAAEGQPANLQTITVLQGHSGAVYAGAEEGRLARGEQKPQSKGQEGWHDRLREYFEAGFNISESRQAVRSVILNVMNFTVDTVWEGDDFGDHGGFNEYFTSGGTAKSFADLKTLATGAYDQLQTGFTAAQGIIR